MNGYHKSTCTVETSLVCDKPNEGPSHLRMNVFDKDGKEVASNETSIADIKNAVRLTTAIPNAKLWSPDSPYLYRVVVTLCRADKKLDQRESRFGLRKIEYEGEKILLNGKRIFLAGYGDDHMYPVEFAMPSDKSVHLTRLKAIKKFGFNHVRHHSVMMPDEYYEACDELGILSTCEFLICYSVYAPGDSKLAKFLPPGHNDLLGGMPVYLDRFAAAVKQYRNHPSILCWVGGNELGDRDRPFTEPFWKIAKQFDPDRAFILSDGCYSTNKQAKYQLIRPTQYKEWGNLFATPGKYEVKEKFNVPLLVHEMGNYLSFPKLNQVALFDKTAFKPFWFTRGVEKIKKLGLADETDKWVATTEKQYLFTHKYNIELVRKNDRISGYHWWLIQDYWTTSNGIFDLFFREKSYRPEDILPFNSPVVLLNSGVKFSNRSGETAAIRFHVSNFAPDDLKGQATATFSLDGKTVKAVTFHPLAPAGRVSDLGALDWTYPDVDSPSLMTIDLAFRAGQKTYKNAWTTWVYPRKVASPKTVRPVFVSPAITFLPKTWSFKAVPTEGELPANAIYLVSKLDLRLVQAMERGARVILFGKVETIPNRPIFWQSSWWKAGDDLKMGTYACSNHTGTYVYPNSATDAMVHDNWCDISWYELINGSKKDIFPEDIPRPEVMIRTVSSIVKPEDSSLLYRVALGQGSLIVSKLRHAKAGGLGPNDWLCAKLVELADSDTNPKAAWPAKLLLSMVCAPKEITVGFEKVIAVPETIASFPGSLEDNLPAYLLRQNKKGSTLTWQTQPVGQVKGSTHSFIFAGAMGFYAEPKTDGFLLKLNDRAILRFDLPQNGLPLQWKSDDGKSVFRFGDKPTPLATGADSYGEITLTVPVDFIKPGQSQTLSVESLGEKSRRWFCVQPFTDF
ncbi:MAG: glycoside hydrolase family 2 TIM barrel-domain containing protein [Thermoguttaceae bacterium]|nr:glycoside hydrolase family 2 TIM barrel-domain containing protein [Thermoguttaceae bacterium]